MTKRVKTSELAPVDWPAIEPHYRAGIRSIKAIAAEFGVSRPAIDKHARKNGWVRDLAPAIREKSDRQVAQVAVAPPGCTPTRPFSDRTIVDAGAEQLTLVRLGHRRDIEEVRRLAKALLGELGDVIERPDAYAMVYDALSSIEDGGMETLRGMAELVISLPARERVLRGLADTMQRLVAMERESFGLNSVSDGGDRPTVYIKDYTGRAIPGEVSNS